MIKVSICITTYNHERFIAQALDSVLMQDTDFDYEIILGEDESQDGTRDICIDYAKRYPDRIRLFLRTRKDVIYVHGKPTGKFNFVENLKAARGEYIALLEGDDYWTDPLKLRRQVKFLDAHKDYTVCFHYGYRLIETTGEIIIQTPRVIKSFYTLDDLVRSNFISTASIMLRNGLVTEFPSWFYNVIVTDWPLLIVNAQHGNIGLIDQIMSVYRVHDGGMWSGAVESERLEMAMSVYDALRIYLDTNYEKHIKAGISDYFLDMAVVNAHQGNSEKAQAYLRKSIVESPIHSDMRLLDKLVLSARVYTPPIYNALKQLQGSFQTVVRRFTI